MTKTILGELVPKSLSLQTPTQRKAAALNAWPLVALSLLIALLGLGFGVQNATHGLVGALLLRLGLGLVGVRLGGGGFEEGAVLFAFAGEVGEGFAGAPELVVGGCDALGELAAILQKVALVQAIADYSLDEGEDEQSLRELAQQLSPEDVQLFYQIALIGRRDKHRRKGSL